MQQRIQSLWTPKGTGAASGHSTAFQTSTVAVKVEETPCRYHTSKLKHIELQIGLVAEESSNDMKRCDSDNTFTVRVSAGSIQLYVDKIMNTVNKLQLH
jgi:hypothetical protein